MLVTGARTSRWSVSRTVIQRISDRGDSQTWVEPARESIPTRELGKHRQPARHAALAQARDFRD